MTPEYTNESYGEADEFASSLRTILSDNYESLTDEQVEEVFASTLENMHEEDVEEIFGLLAKGLGFLAPKIFKGVGSLIRKFKGKRRRRRVYGRKIQRKFRRGLRPNPQTALRYLTRLINNPKFLSIMTGRFINNATGKRIGRSKSRIFLRSRSGRREVMEYSFENYMNALAYLANAAVGNEAESYGYQEYGSEEAFNSDGSAESLVETLLADEWEITYDQKEEDEAYSEYVEDEFFSYS